MPESLNLTGDIADESCFAFDEPGRQDWDEGCNDGCGCGVCGNDPDLRDLVLEQGSDVAMRRVATQVLSADGRSRATQTLILEERSGVNSQMHQFLRLKIAQPVS
jgi:hypothetical protein